MIVDGKEVPEIVQRERRAGRIEFSKKKWSVVEKEDV